MKITKKVQTEIDVVESVVCDICKKPTIADNFLSVENSANLSANWGYPSKYDSEYHNCDMCIKCYDKVKDFIENTLQGSITVQEDVDFLDEKFNKRLDEAIA